MGNKRNQEQVREARNSHKAAQGRVIKDKFAKQREERRNTSPLKPMNELQKEYIRLLREKDIVIASGLAGTSKTYIPTVMACDDYSAGNVDKIYITRPNVSNSKSLGYFGGDLVEKMSNWLLPVLSIMNERLGAGEVECGIRNGNITFVPFEVIKGMSFSNAWVIGDEMEDCTYEEVKKFVTRLGKDVKCAIAGDISQSEFKHKSGLQALLNVREKRDYLKEHVGHVDFDKPSYIVRSDQCREWILGFREYESDQ